MLPVFARGKNGDLCLKPIVQLVFEQLYHVGFREFCFIVGRGKRAIEDHFTPDFPFISMLDDKGLDGVAGDLESFYKMIDSSTLSWVNQSEPRGFGDAVLKAKSFAGDDRFLVHAGDSHFLSKDSDHLKRIMKMSEKSRANALFLSMEVNDPSRFGIIEGESSDNGLMRVKHLEEKPSKSVSKLAIMPVYIFDANIFRALEATEQGLGGELQLTDGIQKMVDWDLYVYTTPVASSEIWIDIGSPDLYWQAQNLSHKHFSH
jgi:UTP--glucose-1-phosphate uridylyltransferase